MSREGETEARWGKHFSQGHAGLGETSQGLWLTVSNHKAVCIMPQRQPHKLSSPPVPAARAAALGSLCSFGKGNVFPFPSLPCSPA